MSKKFLCKLVLFFAVVAVFFIFTSDFCYCQSADSSSTAPGIAENSNNIKIRILLARIKGDLRVSSVGGIKVCDENGSEIFRETFDGVFTFKRNGDVITVDLPKGKKDLPKTVVISSLNPESPLKINEKRYRGDLKAVLRDDFLWLINVLDLEKYLYGVVPCEFDSGNIEMTKAQAIVSRTYALGHLGRYEKLGYDFSTGTQFQVYEGCGVEVPQCTEAVDETRGLVITYQGKLAKYPLYHSTCGGATDGNETVYLTEPIGYLRSVKCVDSRDNKALENKPQQQPENQASVVNNVNVNGDFLNNGADELCKNSSYHRWTAKFSYQDMIDDMRIYGGNKEINEIKDIKVTERGEGGRIKSMVVLTDKGDLKIEGDRIRSAFAFKNKNRSASYLYSTRFLIDKKGEKDKAEWTFRGSGWGHGVGMCQYGALGMAKKGYRCEDILKKYYTGIEIQPYKDIITN